MLASIHPLGERARGNRWTVTAGWYVAASTAGGASAGAVLGAVFARSGASIHPIAIAVLCVIAAAVEASGWRLPSWRRQVNEDWLARYRGWVYGAGFGFQLGTGVATTVTTPAVYLALVLAAFSGSLSSGAIIGATFGLARAVPILAVARVDQAGPLRRLHARMASGAAWAKAGTVLGLLGVAAGGLR